MTDTLLAVGGINIDVHLFGRRSVESEPEYSAETHLVAVGGKAANVARAAATLHVATALVGVVGDDSFGREALERIDSHGVDTASVRVSGSHPTGFAAIRLEAGRHRTAVFSPGANEDLSAEEVSMAIDTHQPVLIAVQAEVPRPVLDFIARCDVPYVLDPCPTSRVDSRVLANAYLTTPNQLEAAELSRQDPDSLDVYRAATELAARTRAVALKLGAGGTLIARGDELIEVAAPRVRVADETGAGDVFLAAAAGKIMSERPLVEAIQHATVAAALSVAEVGVGFPNIEEIERALAEVK